MRCSCFGNCGGLLDLSLVGPVYEHLVVFGDLGGPIVPSADERPGSAPYVAVTVRREMSASPSRRSMVVSVKRRVLWTVINVLGFLVAVVIFYLGLGVGLAFNPLLGALLWILALALMP